LDVLDSFSEIPVCVGYRCDGESLDSMPAEVERLARVEPVYSARLAEVAQPCASAGGPTASRQGLPGPAPGPCTRTHPIRERGHASRSDHRSDVTVAR